MPSNALVAWGDPDVARAFLAAALGLGGLVALAVVGTAAAGVTGLPQPRHSTLLTALQALVGIGVLLAVANGYLGGGPVASLALVLAPTLVAVAGMVASPALGLSDPDVSGRGAVLLQAYFLAVASALGLAGFAAGRAAGWLVGSLGG